MENSNINIGDLIRDLPVTAKSASRIANLVQEDNFLQNLLKNYGHFPKNLQQALGLHGYQAKTLKEELIKRLPNLLTAQKEVVWRFYKQAFVLFLQKEMPELQELLLKEKIEKRQYSGEELIEKVIQFSAGYKIPPLHLQRLQNYWPFEEVSSLLIMEKDIVSTCQEAPTLDMKNEEKSPNDSSVDLQQIKRQLEKSSKQLMDEHKKLWEETVAGIHKTLDTVKGNPESISLLETKSTKLNEKTLRHENEIIKIRAEIKAQARESKQEIQTEIKELNKILSEQSLKSIQDLYTTVNGRLDDIVNAVNANSKYINNSEAKLDFKDERKRSVVKQEEIFVNAWVEYINDDCNISISSDEAMFYHSVFKSCGYLIVENEAILDSWIKFLGFHNYTNVESAGPLWHSRMDWYGTSKFLETPNDKPRIALIRNFNLGITNSYLYPVIDRWKVSGISKSQKLFLIPSISNEESLSYRELLEIVPVLKNDIKSLTSDNSWVKHHNINLQNNLPSINKPTFESWIKECNLTENRRELLDTPCRSLGIKLPESLLHSYNELIANLSKYFDPKESALAAIELSFKPYIVAVHGEEKFDRYADLIKAFL